MRRVTVPYSCGRSCACCYEHCSDVQMNVTHVDK